MNIGLLRKNRYSDHVLDIGYQHQGPRLISTFTLYVLDTLEPGPGNC